MPGKWKLLEENTLDLTFYAFITAWIFREIWIISIVSIDRLINGWVKLNYYLKKNF